jgi:KUP system potassium uptake protein
LNKQETNLAADLRSDDPLADDSLVHDPNLHVPRASTLERKATLTLAALGVVYGDIGTSPLYAVRQSVLAAGGHVPERLAILGAISLIFWSLIVVVTIKYVVLIMRADNDGEGGVLALASLAHRSPGIGRRAKSAIGIAAIIGLALFFGPQRGRRVER